MLLSKGQAQIVEKLLLEPLDVNGLMEVTGLSSSFIRNAVKYLEAAGRVEKVDKRLPYIYRIPLDSPLIKQKELIEYYKEKLLAKDKSNTIVAMLIKAPVTEWVTYSDDLEAAAYAIRELDGQGKLIETLED